MAQYSIWEKEYQHPQLITDSDEPSTDFKHFIKYLRKTHKVDLDGLQVLDLGSGNGKNAFFLAERGAIVTGYELSDTAVQKANHRAQTKGAEGIRFTKRDIGQPYPLADATIDLVIDVICSNSLDEEARELYLAEVSRVLKPGGYFFVRALAKEGDKNAQKLLTSHPGPEKDTYIMPEFGLIERVFSKEDFEGLYGRYFTIELLERKSSYSFFKGRPFKRSYWLAYMHKPL
jgi:SAM-dependent methyltransferase